MKKLSFVLLPAIFVFTLAACSDIPDEAQGEKFVAKRYEKSECLKLVGFKKTDGQKSEFGGVQAYKMEYSATVEIKTGCYGFFSDENAKFFSGTPNKSDPNKNYAEQAEKDMKNMGYRLVKEGDTVAIKGRINFGKSENGWKGSEIR